jgi:hypothetical protein
MSSTPTPQFPQPPMAPQQVQQASIPVAELPPEVRLLLDLYSESNHLVLLCMEIDEEDIKRKQVFAELREQCKVVGRLVRELDRMIRRRAEEIRRRQSQLAQQTM